MTHCTKHAKFDQNCHNCRQLRENYANATRNDDNSLLDTITNVVVAEVVLDTLGVFDSPATPDFGGFDGGSSGGGGASGDW